MRQPPCAPEKWGDIVGVDPAMAFPLRPGVDVFFDPVEPAMPADLGLDPGWKDDRLVASVYRLARANEGVCVEVRARDITVEMKFKRLRIPATEPPEAALLPDEPDPDQQRIRVLEKELAELRAAAPKLVLAFRGEGGTLVRQGEATLRIPRRPTTDEIQAIIAAARKVHHPMEKVEVHDLSAMMFRADPNYDARVDAYNASLAAYFEELRSFLQNYREKNDRLRCFLIRLRVFNAGQRPAENIRLTVRFPDTVSVHLKAPKAPPIPQAPTAPRLRMLLALDAFQQHWAPGGTAFNPSWNLPLVDPLPSFNRPDIRGNTVSFRERRLEHSHGLDCKPVLVAFNSLTDIRPFQISYSFYADNLPRMDEGELNIIVKREDLDTPNLPAVVETKKEGDKVGGEQERRK
ncbi:hypothetical protein PSR1_02606 [Anaeromyxobacter sp. PSR-1]|nr:hypothetical protein PSR1_02606 [Anaeromyxobacter sp. PSR-1]